MVSCSQFKLSKVKFLYSLHQWLINENILTITVIVNCVKNVLNHNLIENNT